MGARFVRFGRRVVDIERQMVTGDGDEVPLTTKEAQLLAFLVTHVGQTVRRDDVLAQVWGYAPTVVTRAVDKAVVRIRAKIGDDARVPRYLMTVFGEGYRLQADSLGEDAASVTLWQGDESRLAAPRGPQRGSLDPATIPLALAEPPDAFVGRTLELAAIDDALSFGRRIVTLVGPGGVGKTRLAVRALSGARGPMAVPVELLGARAAGGGVGVVGRLALALGIELRPTPNETTDVVVAAILRAPTLLLFDGAEDCLDEVVQATRLLIVRCPEVVVLSTSRMPLAVRGELVIAVDGLAERDAVDLLVSRSADRGVELDPAEPSLRRVAIAVDGLPLALEIASAQLSTLSPHDLALRVESAAGLHLRGPTDAPLRHRTLDAVIASAWALLSTPDRAALSQLAIFDGGFTIAAATSVLDLEGGPSAQATVTRLVRSSLVRAPGASGRLALYAAVRDFVLERCAELPDSGRGLQDRHSAWCASLALGQWDVVSPLEEANLALAWSRADSDGSRRAAIGLCLAVSRSWNWARPGWDDVIEEALALGPEPVMHLRLRAFAAMVQVVYHRVTAVPPVLREAAEASVDAHDRMVFGAVLARVLGALGDVEGAARVLARIDGPHVNLVRAVLARAAGDYAAAATQLRLAANSLEPDVPQRVACLNRLGHVLLGVGDLDGARGAFQEALGVAAYARTPLQDAALACGLAWTELTAFDFASAESHVERGLALASRDIFDGTLCALCTLRGEIAVHVGRMDDADLWLTRAVELAAGARKPRTTGWALMSMGSLRWRRGDLAGAVLLLEQAHPIFVSAGEVGEAGRCAWILAACARADGKPTVETRWVEVAQAAYDRFPRLAVQPLFAEVVLSQ